MRISTSLSKRPQSTPVPAAMGPHGRKMAACEPGRGPHQMSHLLVP